MFKSSVPAFLVACAALLAIVAPAAAATGTVGTYSLTDTKARPGATAKYKYVISDREGENHWQLKRLVVRPPNMKAVAGKSSQSVGWSFTVQRVECFEPPCSWEDRYTSPVFMAVTSDAAIAAFSKESVSVSVPTDTAALFHYRVIVKMFWFKPGGSVQGSATAHVNRYDLIGPSSPDQTNQACPGGVYA